VNKAKRRLDYDFGQHANPPTGSDSKDDGDNIASDKPELQIPEIRSM
jgi:hypothetical protein